MSISCNIDNVIEFDLWLEARSFWLLIYTKQPNSKTNRKSSTHNLCNFAEESREYNTRITLAKPTINLTRTRTNQTSCWDGGGPPTPSRFPFPLLTGRRLEDECFYMFFCKKGEYQTVFWINVKNLFLFLSSPEVIECVGIFLFFLGKFLTGGV